ncbi:MAG: hypothetical protein CL966_03575 [Euryarchaeota archaeon]|nr:hypothetical protein [Euryarchaeota archaeon]MBN87243.1 hypothetical protein [Euryarchaeota archaeon]
MGCPSGEVELDYAIIAAWGCNTIVILGVGTYIVFEILKRWRVGLRLSALDESLLNDEVVTVEIVTDAPQGSSFVAGAVAEFVEDRRDY